MKLYIKYMVSIRCKLIVKSEIMKLGHHFMNAELGMVEIKNDLSEDERKSLTSSLKGHGMNLLDHIQADFIRRAELSISKLIRQVDQPSQSDIVKEVIGQLDYNQAALSALFSETKGISLKQYIMMEKVECVKEMLLYENVTITKIAELLNFGSSVNLSYQFKKITGLSPSYYKSLRNERQLLKSGRSDPEKNFLNTNLV